MCREEEPDPALAFIDWIQPVADAVIVASLDAELEELLTGAPDEFAGRLVPVVPTQLLTQYSQAHTFTIQIGHARPVNVPALELDYFLRRTRVQRSGERVKALRSGRVYLNADADGDDVLDSAPAIKWLEASVPMGSERYFLMDGEWFEIGADYVRTSRDAIGRLFPATPSVALPPWSLAANRTEYDYNSYVAARSAGRILCLDKNRKVRDPLGARSPLEICDLLGPDNELIHVKRAEGSAPLSHLFSQGLVSAQSLIHGPAAVRGQFAAEVARLGRGRVLPDGFMPKKIVFAIQRWITGRKSAPTLCSRSLRSPSPTPPESSAPTGSKSRCSEFPRAAADERTRVTWSKWWTLLPRERMGSPTDSWTGRSAWLAAVEPARVADQHALPGAKLDGVQVLGDHGTEQGRGCRRGRRGMCPSLLLRASCC